MKKPDYSLKFLNLHYDVLSVILGKVGEESHSDLVNCIFTCKTFRLLSKYPNVLRSLNLNNTFSRPFLRVPEKSSFLYECDQSGNVHAILLCGLIDYFFMKQTLSGSRMLKLAAYANNPEAMYLHGMTLINENQLTAGSNYLKKLWEEKGLGAVRLCMENCKTVVLEMSVRQYREYEILLSVMELSEGCEAGNFDEACNKCFIYKEIYRFIDYMNNI